MIKSLRNVIFGILNVNVYIKGIPSSSIKKSWSYSLQDFQGLTSVKYLIRTPLGGFSSGDIHIHLSLSFFSLAPSTKQQSSVLDCQNILFLCCKDLTMIPVFRKLLVTN